MLSTGVPPPAGTYTKLAHAGRGIVMSDTPDEMRDHQGAIARARGSCLINGLGLGMFLAAVLNNKPDVSDVTVVEIDVDVIALVGLSYAADRRLTIVHADAFAYQPPPYRRYAMIYGIASRLRTWLQWPRCCASLRQSRIGKAAGQKMSDAPCRTLPTNRRPH
jgi:hypothetical protein